MVKKRSPKEVIESTDPKVEHAYIRIPGRSMVDVSQNSSKERVNIDQDKENVALSGYSGKYSSLHEHPVTPEGKKDIGYVAIPGANDLGVFLSEKYGSRQETMHIAQREEDTGEVQGYVTLRKTKNTKLIPGDNNPYSGFDIVRGIAYVDEGKSANKALNEIAKKHSIQIRYTPAQGYEYDSKKLKFVKKHSLEQTLAATTAILGLLGSVFFISSTFTGNAIANLSTKNSSWISLLLFLVGIIGAFFYFRSKNA